MHRLGHLHWALRSPVLAASLLALAGCAPIPPFDDPDAFPSARTATAAQIIDRHFELTGGRAAIDGIDVLTTVADCEGPSGKFKTTVHAASDDRIVFGQTTADEAPFTGHVNGDLAWTVDPASGARERVGPDMAAMFRDHAFHYMVLHVDSLFTDLRLEGRTLLGGILCHAVAMNDPDGRPTTAYFNEQTGRLEGLRLTNPIDRGPDSMIVFFENWDPTDGLTLFHAFTLFHGEEIWRYDFTDIRINEQDESIFAVPGELRPIPAPAAAHSDPP